MSLFTVYLEDTYFVTRWEDRRLFQSIHIKDEVKRIVRIVMVSTKKGWIVAARRLLRRWNGDGEIMLYCNSRAHSPTCKNTEMQKETLVFVRI